MTGNAIAVRKPRSMAVGDFDEDGRPDIAIVKEGSGVVSVFLGERDGTFGSPRHSSVGCEPVDMAAAQLVQGRSHHDMAIACGRSAAILNGRGNGAFDLAQTIRVGQEITSIAVGDVDGNGRTDLVLGDYRSRVWVILQK